MTLYISFENMKTTIHTGLKDVDFIATIITRTMDFFVYGNWINLPELFNSHNSWFSDTSVNGNFYLGFVNN